MHMPCTMCTMLRCCHGVHQVNAGGVGSNNHVGNAVGDLKTLSEVDFK